MEQTNMKYALATFEGRKRHAIGTVYRIRTYTHGTTEHEQTLNLYDRYDHIHFLKLQEISKEEYLQLKEQEK